MLETLDLLNTPADLLIGSPMLLLVDSIDEDPDQPRKEFDQEKLAELAETIRKLEEEYDNALIEAEE